MQVRLSIRDAKLVLDPGRRPYSLHKLLREHKRVMAQLPGDPEWVSGRSAGRELI